MAGILFWKRQGENYSKCILIEGLPYFNRVAFRRTYELEQETSFTVFSNAIGHVLVTRENGEKKYPFGKKITVAPGKVRISIHAGCIMRWTGISCLKNPSLMCRVR